MERTKGKVAAAGVAGVLVIAAIAGGTEEDTTSADADTSAQTEQRAETPSTESVEQLEPTLELSAPDDRSVYAATVKLTGTLDAEDGSIGGATVKVDGRTAPLADGRWSKTVKLKNGENTFEVAASKDGYEGDSAVVTVTRKRTKAQIAASLERKRQNFITQAQAIPYNQLEKNADRYAGQKAVFRGQIMQIQESFGSTFMLLSVTDEGYGFWTDNIWVDYEGTIKGAEDDVITVYGVIEGSKSYETQIGGETYVPQMTAKYVVE